MGVTVRVSLPGYDALTDTNLDHYSLYADIDNVLIKRLLTGQTNVAIPGGLGYTKITVPHNLGYIPFFTVYDNAQGGNIWEFLNNQYNAFQSPYAVAAADKTNLYIINFNPSILPVTYDIFYDNMSLVGTPSITESSIAVKVTRPGKDTSSVNPNDYIMHSDLNNFKILKSGTTSLTFNSAGTLSFAHGANVQTPVKFYCFLKMPDGKTLMASTAGQKSWDESYWVSSWADDSNIYVQLSNGSYPATVHVSYFVTGSGKSGTVPTSGARLAVSSPGHDVLTETNPDNFNFHSDFQTLKYYYSDTYFASVIATSWASFSHGLGYVPFFIGFVSDLQNWSIYNGNTDTVYALMPYFLSNSTISNPTNNTAAWIYADSTNIYLKTWIDSGWTGGHVPATFYFKAFKNNLGL